MQLFLGTIPPREKIATEKNRRLDSTILILNACRKQACAYTARFAGKCGGLFSCLGKQVTRWLGRLDLNQRMPVPKTGALPLGDAPIFKAMLQSEAETTQFKCGWQALF